jgi:hypothetical protein
MWWVSIVPFTQERAARDQHDVAPGDVEAGEGEHRLGEADDPGEREEQGHAPEQRQREPDLARHALLVLGQAPRDDREEDQVVDAEHDLERRQRQEARPHLVVGQKLQHRAGLLASNQVWATTRTDRRRTRPRSMRAKEQWAAIAMGAPQYRVSAGM